MPWFKILFHAAGRTYTIIEADDEEAARDKFEEDTWFPSDSTYERFEIDDVQQIGEEEE